MVFEVEEAGSSGWIQPFFTKFGCECFYCNFAYPLIRQTWKQKYST